MGELGNRHVDYGSLFLCLAGRLEAGVDMEIAIAEAPAAELKVDLGWSGAAVHENLCN